MPRQNRFTIVDHDGEVGWTKPRYEVADSLDVTDTSEAFFDQLTDAELFRMLKSNQNNLSSWVVTESDLTFFNTIVATSGYLRIIGLTFGDHTLPDIVIASGVGLIQPVLTDIANLLADELEDLEIFPEAGGDI